jgi:hypothetical protein
VDELVTIGAFARLTQLLTARSEGCISIGGPQLTEAGMRRWMRLAIAVVLTLAAVVGTQLMTTPAEAAPLFLS